MLKPSDILGAARDILDVAGDVWLLDERRAAQRSDAEASVREASSHRKARLRILVSKAAQIHEIDAQIELLLTLPPRESQTAEALIRDLRQVRDKLARSKVKT